MSNFCIGAENVTVLKMRPEVMDVGYGAAVESPNLVSLQKIREKLVKKQVYF